MLIVGFAPVANASTSIGGRVGSNLTLTAADSPYELTSTLGIPRGVTLTVEKGVELIVLHPDVVFRSAGEVRLEGSSAENIIFTGRNASWESRGINTLWENAGNWEFPSLLSMKFVSAKNIRGVLTDLNQGQSIIIEDSVFTGEQGYKLSRPLWNWVTFCKVCSFERNTFQNLPGFRISDVTWWNQGRVAPDHTFRNNLFIGNSTTKMGWSTVGRFGEWIIADSIQSFQDNSFVDFTSPVIEQIDGSSTWNISGNYFGGKSISEAQSFVTEGLSFGAKIISVLDTPSPLTPILIPTSASQNGSVSGASALDVMQRTLANFQGSATGLTSQQRGQVKAAVEANPNAEKFICTGIRYYSQPTSVNIMVRKRAKAACDYAEQLNPSLSTWYQNKPTQARSYAGKVLLTIKSPK